MANDLTQSNYRRREIWGSFKCIKRWQMAPLRPCGKLNDIPVLPHLIFTATL